MEAFSFIKRRLSTQNLEELEQNQTTVESDSQRQEEEVVVTNSSSINKMKNTAVSTNPTVSGNNKTTRTWQYYNFFFIKYS